ncbi:MAG: CRISPR-associated endonuclease Cas2 [Fibrobacter sp.]|nr:CRISPR-associated endonuclease Cas2 [Fibrobacter sp.]
MQRISEYRTMWLLVFFDLPTLTKADRREHTRFRENLLKSGFKRFQLSIYMRHCFSMENAKAYINRIKNFMPDKGKVSILNITDKQFGRILLFYGAKEVDPPPETQQLEIF